jgi:hypothetical protein
MDLENSPESLFLIKMIYKLIGIGPGRSVICDRDLSPISLEEEVVTSSYNLLGRLALQQ